MSNEPKQLVTLPSGLHKEDVYAAFLRKWNSTEWADVTPAMIAYYLTGYSTVEIPTEEQLVAMSKDEESERAFIRKVKSDMIGTSMKFTDLVNFKSVADLTFGEVFGLAAQTGAVANARFYELIRKNHLSRPADVILKTQGDLLATLPPSLLALLQEAAKQTGAQINIPTPKPTEVEAAPPVKAIITEEMIKAYLANMSAQKEKDVTVAPVEKVKVPGGKKKKGKGK